MKANTRVYNPDKDKKENVAQLWRIHAARKEQVDQVEAGDIIGVIGLRQSITGDTLCDYQHPILLEVHPVSGNRHLDGDRAGHDGGTQETCRHSGDDETPGTPRFVLKKTKRRGKPSSAAWVNCIWK